MPRTVVGRVRIVGKGNADAARAGHQHIVAMAGGSLPLHQHFGKRQKPAPIFSAAPRPEQGGDARKN